MSEKENNQTGRVLHLVFNSVVDDSRVLKCAWSLGNAGWDVLLIGASGAKDDDTFNIGYATVDRVQLKVVVQNRFAAKVLRKLKFYFRILKNFLLITHKKKVKKSSVGIPNLQRAVSVLTPIVMDYQPDVIHAHDYSILPVAGKLTELLLAAGSNVKLVYDAHEYVPGVAHLTPLLANIYSTNERKYAAISASVLSVSSGMSELLKPHLQINFEPELVANDPMVEGQIPCTRDLRADCKISNTTPLMIYSGAVAPQRGLHTAVAALYKMPEVNLAVIVNPSNKTILELIANNSSVANRIHVLPYVPNNELVSYLKGADLGLIPLLHKLNHEISLITKFGEYMQARLPILVSNVKTMSNEVLRLGNGEVFKTEDVDDFVRAATLILDNKLRYQSVYTPEILSARTWEKQAENLCRIYERITNIYPIARKPLPFKLTAPILKKK